jgi:hypothetical protein
MLRKWARSTGLLEQINLAFDETMTPEATLITPEFKVEKLGAFRLGMRNTFAEDPTWKLWVDYKVPNIGLLRNLTISADTNEQHDINYNLQLRREF